MIVTHDYLRDTIQKTVGYEAEPEVRWFSFDGSYKLLTKKQLDEILLYVANKSALYVATKYDCEDYQREMIGWLSKVGLGNCSIGTMGTISYNSAGQAIGGHYGCIVVYLDGSSKVAKYLEPQSGKLYNVGDVTIGGYLGATKVKVFECGF